MRRTTLARTTLLLLVAVGFVAATWQLLYSRPQSTRERPTPPVPLVDVVDSQPRLHPLTLHAAGPVISANELEIRPQVGGRIVELHADFEPGGRIAAGSTLLQIDAEDYRLAVEAAEAEVAKARASIEIEQGRRVVAREELQTLKGSVPIDIASSALALRRPQLDQVQAELAAAENRLQRARLDLQRTRIVLPFDVVVLERTRVGGEVVTAHELIGRVTRADAYWVDLRTQPQLLGRVRVRDGTGPGSRVQIHNDGDVFTGEVVRVRPDLAAGSRLGGIIARVPIDTEAARRLLLGSYVDAEIAAGDLAEAVAVPRRAVRDNARVWVVDTGDRLQVRDARVLWEAGQQQLLAKESLLPGDQVVVSRISGLVPGTQVRTRVIDPASEEAAPAGEVTAGE